MYLSEYIPCVKLVTMAHRPQARKKGTRKLEFVPFDNLYK